MKIRGVLLMEIGRVVCVAKGMGTEEVRAVYDCEKQRSVVAALFRYSILSVVVSKMVAIRKQEGLRVHSHA